MHFTKTKSQQEEPINFYEELFAKKSLEEHNNLEKEQQSAEEKTTETIENTPNITSTEQQDSRKMDDKAVQNNVFNNKYIDVVNTSPIFMKIKEKSKKIRLKYLVPALLMGLIVNISASHYESMSLQHTSQKFTTGLMYNLSETNDLEQIAKNIYLGMKENNWEPTVKVSNANIFVFSLENGGEFTITKSQDIVSTNFHVEMTDFSRIMAKALMTQLEPIKIGGTKNLITNKKYEASKNRISFDLEKIGQGLIPSLEFPLSMPSYIPPLRPESVNDVPTLPPVNIPVSPELEGVLTKNDKVTEEQIKNLNRDMKNYLDTKNEIPKK